MKSNYFAGIDQEQGPRLEIASLIDMSFLMLVFFMVAATLQKEEADLPVGMPGGAGGPDTAVHVERMLIAIDDGGSVTLNGQPLLTRPGTHIVTELSARLSRYEWVSRVANADPSVVVQCADGAAEQRFIDVLSACRRAGIEHISLLDN